MASHNSRVEMLKTAADSFDQAQQVAGDGGMAHTAQRVAAAAAVGGPYAAGGVLAYDGAKAAYQNPNIRRGLRTGTKAALGAVGLTVLAVAGAFTGCTDSVLASIRPDTSISTGGGESALKEIYIHPLKMSPGGYITSINGYKAQWSKKVAGFGPELSETWNNDVKAEVSIQTGSDIKVPYNSDTHQYELTLPDDGWSVTLSSVDTDKTFTPDGNKLGQAANAVSAFAKVLGFNEAGNYTNDIYGNLQGLARAGAYGVTQDACGKQAYPHLKPYIQQEFAEFVSSMANTFNPSLHTTPKDVQVKLPDEVNFTSDYDGLFKSMIDTAKDNDMTVSYDGKPVCKDLPTQSVPKEN